MQKHKSMSKFGSQSSIYIEGLIQKAHEGILLSQDVVRSSSLSSLDPLCSVVPCSISQDNASSTPGHNFNDGENTREKCCVSNYAGGRNDEDTQETTINNISVAENDKSAEKF